MKTKKIVALVLTLSLVGAFALAATMAYLTGQTQPITNAFTVGDIEITLTETGWGEDFKGKIVPGETIAKDPTVTVKANSEPCYLFVYLENTLAVAAGTGFDYVTPNIDPSLWAVVGTPAVDSATGATKTLYRYIGGTDGIVAASTADQALAFFGTVTVPGESFTKESMEALAAKGLEMTIQAYAHQSANIDLAVAEAAAQAFFFPASP